MDKKKLIVITVGVLLFGAIFAGTILTLSHVDPNKSLIHHNKEQKK